MASELLVTPSRATDANGSPYSGAQWFFYTTGTSTPANVYSDAALVTSLGSSVTADSGGKFPAIYFDAAVTYRGVCKNASGSVTLHDIDPINTGIMSSLSGSGGSASIGFLQAGTGAVTRTAQSKMRDMVSVMDFIPVNLHAGIIARTGTTNVASYIQAAIDALNANGGGCLWFPAGRYYCTAEIDVKKHITLQGENPLISTLYFTSINGLRSTWTINGSTGVYIAIRDLGIQASSTSNTGIGFWEQAGTYVSLHNCLFRAWKWCIALDQTELVDIDQCYFQYDNTVATAISDGAAGIWILNGTELNASAAGSFSNRISITRNQFNGANVYATALRDDGGVTRAVRDNNWNGWGRHLHICGATSFLLEGGEHEGVAINNDQIVLSNLAPTGVSKGQPTNVSMCDLFSGTNGTSYHVNVVSCAQLTVERCYFSSGSTNGAINVAGLAVLAEQSNYHAHGHPIYYGNPSYVSSLGRLGGLLTTGAIGYTANTGGTVTQATDKTTGVTLNKLTGAITMNNAALASATTVSFTLTNSTIAATDVVMVAIKSGATAGAYSVDVDAVAAGSCRISLRNNSGGSLGEAVALNYVVIKGSAS